jgi:hypothetical protein
MILDFISWYSGSFSFFRHLKCFSRVSITCQLQRCLYRHFQSQQQPELSHYQAIKEGGFSVKANANAKIMFFKLESTPDKTTKGIE